MKGKKVSKVLRRIFLLIFVLTSFYYIFLPVNVEKRHLKNSIIKWRKMLGGKDSKAVFEKEFGNGIKWSIVQQANPAKQIGEIFYFQDADLKEGVRTDRYRNRIFIIENSGEFLLIKAGSFIPNRSSDDLEAVLRSKFHRSTIISLFAAGENIRNTSIRLGGDVIYLSLQGVVPSFDPLLLILLISIIGVIILNREKGIMIFAVIVTFILMVTNNISLEYLFIILSLVLLKSKKQYIMLSLVGLAIVLFLLFDTLWVMVFFAALLLKTLKSHNVPICAASLVFLILASLLKPGLVILLPIFVIPLFVPRFSLRGGIILLWVFTVLATLYIVNITDEFWNSSRKIDNINSNGELKYSIMKGDMEFVSFILRDYYFPQQTASVVFYDNKGNILDSSRSPFYIDIDTSSMEDDDRKEIEINGIEYQVLHYSDLLKIDSSQIGAMEVDLIFEERGGMQGVFRYIQLVGLLAFILFLLVIFSAIADGSFDLLKIFAGMTSRTILIFFFGGLFFFSLIYYFYVFNDINTLRRSIPKEASLLDERLNKEVKLIKGLFSSTFPAPTPGRYKVQDIEVLVEKGDLREMDPGFSLKEDKMYLASSIDRSDQILLIPFREIIFRLDAMELLPLTVYYGNRIIFNSNIRGIINSDIPSVLHEAIYGIRRSGDLINYFYPRGTFNNSSFTIAISRTISRPPLGVFLYLGIFFLFLILIMINIDMIERNRLKFVGILRNGFIQLRSGNFSFRVKTVKDPGYSELLFDFNFMASRLEELREKEKEHEALKNLERATKKIAHEIKNPLTPVKMLLDHLRNLYNENSKEFDKIFSQSFEIIYEQIDYLKKLSEDFYYLSKLSTVNKESLVPAEFFSKISIIYSGMLERYGVVLDISMADAVLQADHNLLRHIFINLIENSMAVLKEMSSGTITIMGQQFENYYQFVYSDTAGGVDEEILKSIFKPEFSTKKAGMGIGLAFVKQAVDLHYGEVKVENGKNGLVFEILLPLE
ncbi:HAMP domain-containing histidine kinase [bacterium]|nr:HAMP domain-containing histidine kinase [bacterium]